MRPAELGRVLGGVCLVVFGKRTSTDAVIVAARATADVLCTGDMASARRAGQSLADAMHRSPLSASAKREPAVSCTEHAWIATMSAWDGDDKALPMTIACLLCAASMMSGKRPSASDLWQLVCEAYPGLRATLPKPSTKMCLSSSMAKRARQRANRLLSTGVPMADVASRLGVDPKTVERWRENPSITPRKLRKLDAQGEAKLRMILAAPPKDAGYPAAVWTLELVSRMLTEKIGVRYGRPNLQALIDRLQPGIYVPPYCDPRLPAEDRLMALSLLMPRTTGEERAVWDHAVHVIRHSDAEFFRDVVLLVMRESRDIEQAADRLRISTVVAGKWYRRLADEGLVFDPTDG